jgi:hypothetical protein
MNSMEMEREVLPSARKRNLSIISFCLILLLFTFSGCNVLPFSNTPTPEPLAKWVDDLLTKPTCELPCWENISPGETLMKDAFQIVRSREDITLFNGLTYSPVDDYTDFIWNFSDDRGEGWIQSDESGKLVGFIDFSFDNNHIELSKIIDTYGDPDQIFMTMQFWNRYKAIYMIYIFYYDYEMRFMTGYTTKNGILQITSQTIISSVNLSTTEGHLKNLHNFGDYQKYLFDWKGYGDYAVPEP